ncbi:hypothetical protein XELAEV_18009739mg [Xenopus laevis]|uniref:GIY-YIG domain-containing protein n=1 Tax=Xenopus laevis TaxID=8355 RepID=A0A974DUK9_XENLA|nr:hypothetical protein XELAEV_18009739mg [Xenopus laevis]
MEKGYTQQFNDKLIQEVKEVPREALLKEKTNKRQQNRIPFKGKTIKDKLCKAELESKTRMQTIFQSTPQFSTFPCFNCVCCSSIIKGQYVSHPTKGYKIKMKHYATCTTSSVVYLLKCPCRKIYVGPTSRSVKERIKEHKGNIRRNFL